jgi:pyrroloquinoline quinone biosynthesis protein E
MIANPQTYDLGDATDFTGVWTGETMQAFRAAHISGAIPDVCRNCYVEH